MKRVLIQKTDGFNIFIGSDVVHGPPIPTLHCHKYKQGEKASLLKTHWAINYNDPRFAVLNSVLGLIPCRETKWRNKPKTWNNQWWLDLDEYRAIAGREGDIRN